MSEFTNASKRKKKNVDYKRKQWNDIDLEMVMEALYQEHPYSEVHANYNIPRISLKDHMMDITRSRKMESEGILSIDEDNALYAHIAEMIDCRLPLTSTQVKQKVRQMTQEREISFNNGILGLSWWK